MKSVLSALGAIVLCFEMSAPARARSYSAGDSAIASTELSARRNPGTRSERAALLWSLLGTAVPAAVSIPSMSSGSDESGPILLLTGAILVGPS